APHLLRCGDTDIRLVAFSDHPAAYAAAPGRPGIAFADVRAGLPPWLENLLRPGPPADVVLVMPHWGPNMVAEPLPVVRDAAHALLAKGAGLIAGHSAHVFQGVAPRVLFDLGDFLDDYAVDPVLRNDLGLLWFVELHGARAVGVKALPLFLDYCHTRAASPSETDWVVRRLGEL